MTKREIKNRIIIIGNGFDVAHGIRSTYKAFIDSLFTEKSLGKELLDFMKPAEEASDTLMTTNEPLFTKTHKVNDRNIYSISIYNSRRKNSTSQIHINFKMNEDYPEELRNTIADKYIVQFENSFLEHIILRQLENWVDIEEEYFKALKGEIKNNVNEDQFYNKEKLNEELDEVRDLLNDYLFHEYKNTDIYPRDHINDMIHRIYDKPENVLSKDTGIYVINLNYTRTANKYFIRVDNRDIVWLHGFLNGRGSYKPLFGYGDEESDDYKNLEKTGDNELLKNIKSIRYQENESLSRVYDWLDMDVFEVVIMGLSCGFSDRTLLKEIFNHQNCEKMYPNYYGNDSLNRVANISRCFTDKEKFRRRVANKNLCKEFH